MELAQVDPEIEKLIRREEQRQREQLQLIPSENYVSKAVLSAVGSMVINKYSEGQVGKRHYQGNVNIDGIETLVKQRALETFQLNPNEWGVNVQAANGSTANLAVYSALLEVGAKIMGMFLYDGGHLSHGWQMPDGRKVSFTSRVFTPSYYFVDPTKRMLDYAAVGKRAQEERPKLIISGGTAYPREINYAQMRGVADEVGAFYLTDVAHEAGLIAAGVNQSPFPHAHIVTMTTRKTLRGPIGALIFSRREFADKIDRAVFPGLQGGPLNHNIAGIGVALQEALQPEFKEYARQVVVNAKKLADELLSRGYDVVSGGTDKHLILIDLRRQEVGGQDAALALEKAGIIVNKNTVPGDTGKPWRPSGIRLGTPAVTSRSMKEPEMEKIAAWLDEVIKNMTDENLLARTAAAVKAFASQFPMRGVDD